MYTWLRVEGAGVLDAGDGPRRHLLAVTVDGDELGAVGDGIWASFAGDVDAATKTSIGSPAAPAYAARAVPALPEESATSRRAPTARASPTSTAAPGP